MPMLEINEASITELYAWLSVDEKGNEGIMADMVGGAWFPFITSKKRIAAALQKKVERITTSKTIRLVRFTNREIVQTIGRAR